MYPYTLTRSCCLSALLVSAAVLALPFPIPPWRGLRQLTHIGPTGVGLDLILSRFREPRVLHVDLIESPDEIPPTIKSMRTLPSPRCSDAVRVVLLSDTHGKHRCVRLPRADVLIHCGDVLLRYGYVGEEGASLRGLEQFDQWLGHQPAKHVFMVAGNHDKAVQCRSWRPANATLLRGDQIHEVAGLLLFGSPYSPPGVTTNDAFQKPRMGSHHASQLNKNVDILVTHAKCSEFENVAQKHAKVWAHGHFHHQYGIDYLASGGKDPVVCANAATCNMIYSPVNPPIVVDILPSSKHGRE